MRGASARGRRRFRKIGIVAKLASPEARQLALSLERALARRGLEVLFDRETARVTRRGVGVPRDRIARLSDMVFVLGGDGTLLSVARLAPSSTPVLGINLGALGFLAGLSRKEALSRLDEVLEGKFRQDKRRRLDVTVSEGPRRGVHRALNDVVLHKETIARISTFSVSVGGEPVSRFRGDGVIVSTPTGSTAYNLSAGGPVLYPTLPAVVVTPICPHTLAQRPLVLPSSSRIGLRVLDSNRREGVRVTLDGQEGFSVPRSALVEVRQCASSVTLLRPVESDHFDKLAEKLRWGI